MARLIFISAYLYLLRFRHVSSCQRMRHTLCHANVRDSVKKTWQPRNTEPYSLWGLYILASLLCISAFSASANQAADPRVVHVRPAALLWHNSAKSDLTINSILEQNDALETNEFGRISLILPNYMLLKIAGETLFRYTGLNQQGDVEGELTYGKVWHRGQRIGTGFTLKTPTATAAIRGTEWYMEVDPGGRTTIGVIDGEVVVSNEYGDVKLGSSEVAVVEAGKKPKKEVYLSPGDSVNWTLQYRFLWSPNDIETAPPEFQKTIRQVIDAYYRDDLAAASDLLSTSNAAFGDTAEWQTLAGFLDLTVGRPVNAREHFQQATTLRPNWALPRAHIALMSLVENKTAQARDEISRARSAEINSASALVVKAYIDKASLDLDQANKTIVKAIRLEPSFVEALLLGATIAIEMKQLKSAQAILEQIPDGFQSIGKNNPVAPAIRSEQKMLSGHIQLHLGNSRLALDHFRSSIDASPAHADAWVGYGIANINLNNTKEGLDAITHATLMAPQNSSYQSYLAKAHYELGDYYLARKAIIRAKRLDPEDPTPWLYEALILYAENRTSAAVQKVEKATALNKNRAVYRSRYLLDQDSAVLTTNVAQLYADLGLTITATQMASQTLAKNPLDPGALRQLSIAISNDPRNFDRTSYSADNLARLFSPVTIGSVTFEHALSPYQSLFNRSGTRGRIYGWLSGVRLDPKDSTFATHKKTTGESYLAVTGKLESPLAYSISLEPEYTKEDYGIYGNSYLDETTDKGHWITLLTKWQPAPLIGSYVELSRNQSKYEYKTYTEEGTFDWLNAYAYSKHPSGWTSIYGYRNSKLDSNDSDNFEYRNRRIILQGALYKHFGQHSIALGLRSTGEKIPSWRTQQTSSSTAFFYDRYERSPQLAFTTGATLDRIKGLNDAYTRNRLNPAIGAVWEPLPGRRIRAAYIQNTAGFSDARLQPVMIAGFPWLGSEEDEGWTDVWAKDNLQRTIMQIGVDSKLQNRSVFYGFEVANYKLGYDETETLSMSDLTSATVKGWRIQAYSEAILNDKWSIHANVERVNDASTDERFATIEGHNGYYNGVRDKLEVNVIRSFSPQWQAQLHNEVVFLKGDAGQCERRIQVKPSVRWNIARGHRLAATFSLRKRISPSDSCRNDFNSYSRTYWIGLSYSGYF